MATQRKKKNRFSKSSNNAGDKRKSSISTSGGSSHTPKSADPLFIILDQHLCNFNDSNIDRQSFTANVVKDYLSFLRQSGILIPTQFEKNVIQELGDQVNSMLVKRIYGCFSIEEYQRSLPDSAKKKADVRYSRLKSHAG